MSVKNLKKFNKRCIILIYIFLILNIDLWFNLLKLITDLNL